MLASSAIAASTIWSALSILGAVTTYWNDATEPRSSSIVATPVLLVLMLSEMTCSASRTVGACIETSPVSPIDVMFLRAPTRSPKDSQPVAFTHSVASLPTAANGRSLSGSENIAGSIPALRSTASGSAPRSVSVGRIAAAFRTLMIA